MIRRRLKPKDFSSPAVFQWRGKEVLRLEELSDAVIAFALTLLVVSLEVPQTFDDLLVTMRGFGAFALCFCLLVIIWYEHYTYFRRYGLQDTYVMVWNTVLLFLIVFYVYPLKFLFTLFFNDVFGMSLLVTLPGGDIAPMIREGQLPQLYIIYGIGWTAVWLVFVLLYRHALKQAKRLELSPLEVFETRASITENLAASIIGILSIGMVWVGVTNTAGFVYLLMFPLTWAIKRRYSIRRNSLMAEQAVPMNE
jgi:uncharacterized membrane protein